MRDQHATSAHRVIEEAVVPIFGMRQRSPGIFTTCSTNALV